MKLERPSRPIKQDGPVISSVSSLNHFTVKGGVPLKVLLKRTVVFGTTACGSGTTTKLGSSKCFQNRNTDNGVKEVAAIIEL